MLWRPGDVFANKMSVESDFYIFKWELDENRTALMHLSMEGIFQAKQRAPAPQHSQKQLN
jgi:hypothetical protein